MQFCLDARTATSHFPGIGRYVVNLARSLAPLLTPDERLTLLYDPAHPPLLPPSKGLQLVPVVASPFSLRQQWTLPLLLRRLASDDGQLLYHSPYYLMPYRPGVPTVLTVYDLIPLLFPHHSTARARLLFRWMTALALRASHHVIAISEATRRDFVTHFRLPSERITTVNLAADPAFRPQPPEAVIALRARYELPDHYVLYLGSNKPHKNLVHLIEAWSHVSRFTPHASRITLVIAGAWDPRYPEARQRATALGLDEHVRWLGPVPDEDLPALYSGADLFVFLSLYEGFGLPPLEAMACGTPVIASNTSSLPEVVGDAGILVDPHDVAGLVEAIERLLTDDHLRAGLRARGLEQAGRFTWEKTARQTLRVYCQAITCPPAGNPVQ